MWEFKNFPERNPRTPQEGGEVARGTGWERGVEGREGEGDGRGRGRERGSVRAGKAGEGRGWEIRVGKGEGEEGREEGGRGEEEGRRGGAGFGTAPQNSILATPLSNLGMKYCDVGVT